MILKQLVERAIRKGWGGGRDIFSSTAPARDTISIGRKTQYGWSDLLHFSISDLIFDPDFMGAVCGSELRCTIHIEVVPACGDCENCLQGFHEPIFSMTNLAGLPTDERLNYMKQFIGDEDVK